MRAAKFLRAGVLLALMSMFVSVAAREPDARETDPSSELYRATTLRAAPGRLLDLIALYRRADAEGRWRAGGEAAPMLMRHSQGDHWDLLVLQPLGGYADYFSAEAIGRRAEAGEAAFVAERDALLAFKEDLFAHGPARARVEAAYAENGFFHIEMFRAGPGRHAELLRQRRIENDYLIAIGGRANFIWVGDQGSDVDVFTIGFYPGIVEFAAPNSVSDEQAELAAKAAGFRSRADIGPYLRELLMSHHDTLAVKP